MFVPAQELSIKDWWCEAITQQPKPERRKVAALLMYTVWNLWKERNRRIFEGKVANPRMVLQLITEEVNLLTRACGAPIVS